MIVFSQWLVGLLILAPNNLQAQVSLVSNQEDPFYPEYAPGQIILAFEDSIQPLFYKSSGDLFTGILTLDSWFKFYQILLTIKIVSHQAKERLIPEIWLGSIESVKGP